ncbi:MAG: RDD family protein [Gammaproteobacteria bacterium]|nr:RDD family protein [Gammaproteobacteria bacterium]
MTSSTPPLPIAEDTHGMSSRGEQFTLKDIEKFQILDTKFVQETPEGAELEIRPAGFLARGIAFIVDELIRFLILLVFVIIASIVRSALSPALSNIVNGATLLVIFSMSWFYGVFFEQLNDGKTPGKVVSSIKVTNAEGTPVGIMQSIIRNLFRPVDSLGFGIVGGLLLQNAAIFPLGLPGLFFVLFSKNFRRLGDHLADTITVYTNQPRVVPYKGVSTPISIPATLSLQDQNLLLAFQDRSAEFSDERKIELAEVLEPLHRQRSEEAVNICFGYANSIRGAS